jgi:hypothetical protein
MSRRALFLAKVALALFVAAGFFVIALSEDVYHGTSPAHVGAAIFGSGVGHYGDPFGLSLHVVLRKAYSIVAFAIVGVLAFLVLPPSKRPATRMALLIGLYSAAIEYAQFRDGSLEGPWWNAFDILCGAIGGWLAGRFTPRSWAASADQADAPRASRRSVRPQYSPVSATPFRDPTSPAPQSHESLR